MEFAQSYIGRLRDWVGSNPLIVPGFRALIFDSAGAVLMMRRADSGLWGLPSGNIELGESAAEMISREVLEETGLRVERLVVFGLASDPEFETHVYPNGDHIQNFSILVAIRQWSGFPAPNDGEATALRFVTNPNEIPRKCRVEQETRCIGAYQEYLRAGAFQLL